MSEVKKHQQKKVRVYPPGMVDPKKIAIAFNEGQWSNTGGVKSINCKDYR